MQRREFLTTAAAGTGALLATAHSYGQIQGANDRVRVALIGCGTRGSAVARNMANAPGAQFVAVCDVYDTNAQRAKEWAGAQAESYSDFRRVLDRKDIDAVLVGTPDHWHALVTILACQAGKDVYVEKPLGHSIREGRAMVDAARKHDRVVQTGMQHRSAPHYAEAADIIQSGKLGKVHFVRVWNYLNTPGMTRLADENPPAGLDWDMYLGPAPKVPYNKNRFLATFRWYFDYAGGYITDWGTHRFDSVHQVMGVDAPKSVTAVGGRFETNDGSDVPDILQVTYEYPTFVLSYEAIRLNGHGVGGRSPNMKYYSTRGTDDRPHGEAFYGTNGSLFSDRIGFEIYPELESTGAGARGGMGMGRGDMGGMFTAPPPRPKMERKEVASRDCTDLHTINFIECVRSRKRPVADVEIGHRSAIIPHLGNIAYRAGKKLVWDAAKELAVDNPEANALLVRKAREPWNLVAGT